MILKHFLALVIITLVAFITAHYWYLGLQGLLYLHALVLHSLTFVFAQGKLAELIRNVLAVLAVPLAFGLVFGGLLLAFKRNKLKCVMIVVWTIWLILITVLILQHK